VSSAGDSANATTLLVLAHDDAWRSRFQVTSLAASAIAAGQEVAVALFFEALAAWVGGRWDLPQPQPPVPLDRLEALDLPLYACSASVRILGLDPASVQQSVDAIVGWPTFHRLIRQAERVVTL
jgi:peroxiredoxin family protein